MRSAGERVFLGLGDGAQQWLIKTAAAGTQRLRRKMAEPVNLPKLHRAEQVKRALKNVCGGRAFADSN